MSTSSHIRKFIFALDSQTIFSTRQLVNCGKRSAVDKCLSRLVKKADIVRLARGLFKRIDANDWPEPFIVAAVKAKAFDKTIATSGSVAAETLALIEPQLFNGEFKYVSTGSSSQFKYGKSMIL